MIEFRNVTAIRNKQTLLSGMCFKLNNGRVYGITGNTDTVREISYLLAGARVPASGNVLINGFDLQKETVKAKKFLGFVPATPALYSSMTPVEYLLFFADVRQFDYEQGIRRIGEMLSLAGLSHKRDALISSLTEYEKKCLTFVQALLCDTSILILEDPFSSLNTRDAEKFSSLISEIADEKTVILCTDRKRYLSNLCDVIYVASPSALIRESTEEAEKEEEENET